MRALLAGLLVALAGCVSQASPVAAPVPLLAPLPVEPGVHAIKLPVGGAEADGFLGVPAGGQGTTLVVLAKGLGADAGSWRPLMQDLAAHGALSVAMEYRGAPGTWKVRAAVADTLAATQAVKAQHPEVKRTILFGMSMGGEVSGLVLAQAPPGTFDAWLSGAGVMDLRGEWAEAASFQPLIEAEAGGTPLTAPAAYRELSPIDQAQAIAASGIQRAYLVHGLADTVVPVEQAERMAQALAGRGLPVSTVLVATEPQPWACTPAVIACAPTPLPDGPASHEAGLSKVPLELLRALVDGRLDPSAPLEQSVVEGWTGATVSVGVPAPPIPVAARLPA